MHQAVEEAERTIAVLIPAYLESAFGAVEWRSVFAKDPIGENGLLMALQLDQASQPRPVTYAALSRGEPP